MALPFGSRMVPIAREPSSFLTFVATRTNSSPLLTKIVAVPPASFWTSSTSTKLLIILVAPKCRAGTVLPATTSSPFTTGAPSVAAFDCEEECHRDSGIAFTSALRLLRGARHMDPETVWRVGPHDARTDPRTSYRRPTGEGPHVPL